MNRSLKLSMLMALALSSSQVMALELGHVQIKSTLGQPLLAEIPLHPANPAELQNLKVQLASNEAFARAGIPGGRTTIPLQFAVTRTASGQRVIRITSKVVVDNPFIDLLLEVDSKAGKSVREFAILLDPPGTRIATSSSQTAMSGSTSPKPASHPAKPAGTSRPTAVAARSSSPSRVRNGEYGPVKSGQTLSAVARDLAPRGVDINQMLLALKQANPNAFYRDNVNALKRGAVLRVPTSAETQALTVAAAMAEVRRQNSDWRAGTPGKPVTVADAATRASASSSPSGGSDKAGDHLALVPAKNNKGAGSAGASGGKSDKSTAALRQDLLRSQEAMASLQQQGKDLKTRLKDLTDINSNNERLLSLKNGEIAELQRKLAAARKAAGMPAAAASTMPAIGPGVPAQKASAMAHAPAAGTSATSASPSMAASGTAPAPVVPAVAASVAKPVAKPAPVKPAAEPARLQEQPWYMQTWAWAAAGGAVVLLLLLALLGRRKSAAGGNATSSLADRFGTAEPAADAQDDFDQNELLDQLAEHPDDIYLHLELVTLYYSRRDVDHFEAAAEAMYAHVTDPQQDEWQDVVHMGEDLAPNHPLFVPNDEASGDSPTESHVGFGVGDGADDAMSDADESLMPPLPPTPRQVSEYSFDFDLSQSEAPATPGHDAEISPTEDVSGNPQVDDFSPNLSMADDIVPTADEPASSWRFDEADAAGEQGREPGELNDDPVDTKLDLARAYLDMGDAEGARAMLEEAVREGSQTQQETARRLLDGIE
ncbi:MAG: fimbrial protein FimV [Rhodanobacter sp.]|nr:MAG: fimbrial protein FimV [Rhodanobacter sp.]